MRENYIIIGLLLVGFSFLILLFPEYFNVGTFIGIGLFLIIIGIIEKGDNRKESLK